MPEGESENLFFKTPPGRRLSIWGAAILAAIAQERDPPAWGAAILAAGAQERDPPDVAASTAR